MTQDSTNVDDLQDDQVDISSEAERKEAEFAESTQQDSSGELNPEQLQAEVRRLQDELQKAHDQALRAQAEAQNARRRAEQDIERAHKYGIEKFVSDMLPVADNLERAVVAATDQTGDFAAVAEGVELTLKSLQDALQRHHVEQVDPAGEPFDPQLHQAMTAVEQPDAEPNTVLEVFQRGYTLHGRLVRPAMVVVSKAPQKKD